MDHRVGKKKSATSCRCHPHRSIESSERRRCNHTSSFSLFLLWIGILVIFAGSATPPGGSKARNQLCREEGMTFQDHLGTSDVEQLGLKATDRKARKRKVKSTKMRDIYAPCQPESATMQGTGSTEMIPSDREDNIKTEVRQRHSGSRNVGLLVRNKAMDKKPRKRRVKRIKKRKEPALIEAESATSEGTHSMEECTKKVSRSELIKTGNSHGDGHKKKVKRRIKRKMPLSVATSDSLPDITDDVAPIADTTARKQKQRVKKTKKTALPSVENVPSPIDSAPLIPTKINSKCDGNVENVSEGSSQHSQRGGDEEKIAKLVPNALQCRSSTISSISADTNAANKTGDECTGEIELHKVSSAEQSSERTSQTKVNSSSLIRSQRPPKDISQEKMIASVGTKVKGPKGNETDKQLTPPDTDAVKNNHKSRPEKVKTKAADDTKNRSKSSPVVGGGKEGECLRRIKREWKDAVKLGIAYDWTKSETVVMKRRRVHIPSSSEISNNSAFDSRYNYVRMGPFGKNLLRWHFSVAGPPNSVYEEGIYHGRVLLPKDYPGSPPRVQMLTPSGRFVVGEDICLSASNYHPETWSPRWTVLSLIDALRLHMLTSPNEIGGVHATDEIRRRRAIESRTWHRGVVDHQRMTATGIFMLRDLSSSNGATGETDVHQDSVDDDRALDDIHGNILRRRTERMAKVVESRSNAAKCLALLKILLRAAVAVFTNPFKLGMLLFMTIFAILNRQ